MTEIKSSVSGNEALSLSISRNNYAGDEVFIRRLNKGLPSPPGIVLTQWEAYELIAAIADNAGIRRLASLNGFAIEAPEHPSVKARKEELAVQYFGENYRDLASNEQRIVDRIVELEQKAGELN